MQHSLLFYEPELSLSRLALWTEMNSMCGGKPLSSKSHGCGTAVPLPVRRTHKAVHGSVSEDSKPYSSHWRPVGVQNFCLWYVTLCKGSLIHSPTYLLTYCLHYSRIYSHTFINSVETSSIHAFFHSHIHLHSCIYSLAYLFILIHTKPPWFIQSLFKILTHNT